MSVALYAGKKLSWNEDCDKKNRIMRESIKNKRLF